MDINETWEETILPEILIEVDQLSKQYMKQMAVHNVSFQINRGMICGLIGPNGAGKTTIMKMLGGLVLPTDGSISIYGRNDEKGLAMARRRMSFMIETPYAKEKMTARENLEKQRLQKGLTDKNRVDEVLGIVGLEDTGKKPVRNFSLGMRQRLGIANALLTKPEIMVLDEPINGLDPEGIVEIRELLLKLNKEGNITILISSHILSELSLLCTDYLFMNHGKLIESVQGNKLERMCRKYYKIHTDHDELALDILKIRLGVKDYEMDTDGIRLYEHLDDIRMVSKTLYEGGVIPLSLNLSQANLEQFYMDMITEKG